MMIRRFFLFLLVVLTLANQSLCLAHVQHEHGTGDPEGHDSRPHVHLGGHKHHHDSPGHDHHSHGSDSSPKNSSERVPKSPCSCPLGDHDSDAVYVGESEALVLSCDSANVLNDKQVVAGLAIVPAEHRGDELLHAQPLGGQSFFLDDGTCPIYLRALFLRL